MTTEPEETNGAASEPKAPIDGRDATVPPKDPDDVTAEDLGKPASDAPVDEDSPSDTAN